MSEVAPEGSSGPEDLGSVGPYRLLSILGEGGMGSVYLAEQSEPIRGGVALKVIKRGWSDFGRLLVTSSVGRFSFL